MIVSNQHTALFYESKEEYLDIVIPFIKSGLENNEFVLWIYPEFISGEQANLHLNKSLEKLDFYIKNEKILIQDYKAIYLKEGMFSSSRTLDDFREFQNKTLEKGFFGLRVVGDGSWALKDQYWWDFMSYEVKINSMIESMKIKALCTYFKKNIDVMRVIDIGKNHQQTIVNQRGVWNKLMPGKFRQWTRNVN